MHGYEGFALHNPSLAACVAVLGLDDPELETIRMLAGFDGYAATVGFWKGTPVMHRLLNFQADLSFSAHLDTIRERAHQWDQRQAPEPGVDAEPASGNGDRRRGNPTGSFKDTAEWWSLVQGRVHMTLRDEPLAPGGLLPWSTVEEHVEACLRWTVRVAA